MEKPPVPPITSPENGSSPRSVPDLLSVPLDPAWAITAQMRTPDGYLVEVDKLPETPFLCVTVTDTLLPRVMEQRCMAAELRERLNAMVSALRDRAAPDRGAVPVPMLPHLGALRSYIVRSQVKNAADCFIADVDRDEAGKVAMWGYTHVIKLAVRLTQSEAEEVKNVVEAAQKIPGDSYFVESLSVELAPEFLGKR